MSKCECSTATRVLGDGCEVCNPELALEHAKQTIADQNEELDQLRAENPSLAIANKQMREALETCVDGDYSTGHVIAPSFDADLVNEALATTSHDELIAAHDAEYLNALICMTGWTKAYAEEKGWTPDNAPLIWSGINHANKLLDSRMADEVKS